MGPGGGDDAAWSAAVLHPLPQDGRTVRRLRGRLSAALCESERAGQAGRSRHGDAFHARRPQALRAHCGAALRRGSAGPPRDEEDRQRGRDPARLQGGRRDGRGRLAAPTPAILCGAAAGRAVDPRRRYDDQAALRPPGRGGSRLQSQEAGASEPLLSHVFDGFDASDPRCRCQSRRRACVQTQRAEPVGAHRSFAARPVAGFVAGRPGLRQRGDHARGGGAGASVSLETAADRQRQAHDREARLGARMGRRRPGPRVEEPGGRFGWWAGAASGA